MTTHSKVTAEQVEGFEPVEGTWDSNIPSSDDRDYSTIQDEVAASIKAATGFEVKVELFRSNGHAIHDEMPGEGNFLATRK